MAGGKYDSGVVEDIDPLLAKFLCTESFYFDKLLEVNLYAIFTGNVKIGRLV